MTAGPRQLCWPSTGPLMLHLDFETRSVVDLKKTGLYRYAADPSTDIWCACWLHEVEGPGEWRPGQPVPDVIRDVIRNGGLVYSHNFAFEHAIWTYILTPRYGWPALPLELGRCTAAMAAAMSLPRDLSRAAIAVGLGEQKDMGGRKLMLQMSKPRSIDAKGKPIWWNDPEKLEALIEYCRQDVRTEHALAQHLRPLPDKELDIWRLDQIINARGVEVDIDAALEAVNTVESELYSLDQELERLTKGEVRNTRQVSVLQAWLEDRCVHTPSLAAGDIKNILQLKGIWDAADDDLEMIADLDWFPPDRPIERRVLEIRQESAKSSTAKLKRFFDRVEYIDGGARCRENFMYHGAGTGRWSGRGLQLQNLPRGVLGLKEHQIEDAIECIGDAEFLRAWYGPPLVVISDCIRGMITAKKGHTLICADYSNIEGRGLPWLAGDERKLELFRLQDLELTAGIYEQTAARIYGIPVEEVDKPKRLIGKVAELACGYQGGVGAFQSMARIYGLKVPDSQAEDIKTAWRKAHSEIVNYWYALEDAARNAVKSGRATAAGPRGRQVKFGVKGNVLWMRLPSGRLLAYPSPSVRETMTPWGEMKPVVHFHGVDGKTHQWTVQKTYGGSLAENVCQAICRDILAEAMLRLEAAGYPIVLHAHDEIVAEVPIGFGSLDEFCEIMCATPEWAGGFPIVAAGWTGNRYRKA